MALFHFTVTQTKRSKGQSAIASAAYRSGEKLYSEYTHKSIFYQMEEMYMEFFASAVDTLKVLVMAIGCGLGAWGIVNLLEGYGADNPASKSQGMKQFVAN